MKKKRLSNKKNAQKGFTLVELIIVVIILGLLASYALASMENSMRRGAMNTTVESLRSAMEVTRQKAYETARRTVICPSVVTVPATSAVCSANWTDLNYGNSPASPGWIVFSDLNNNSQKDPDEPVLHSTQFSSKTDRVRFRAGASVVGAISFTPKGTTTSNTIGLDALQAGTVKDTCDIRTFIAGRIRKEGEGC